MDFGVIFMICTIVFIVVISPLIVPPPWRLMAAIWLAVFQIYLFPIQGLYFSLAFLCAIGLWPEVLKHGRELLHWRIVQCYLLLLAVQIVSLSWSPDVGKGVRLIALSLPFLPILAATIDVVERRPQMILLLLYGVMAGAVVEAALVISFQFIPGWERTFFSSSMAHVFINPNTVSVKQRGGFLMNPNTAAGYLGIISLLAQALTVRYRQWWMACVGLFLAFGVVATGSKAGLILLCLCYGLGISVLVWPRLQRWSKNLGIILAALIGIYLLQNSQVLTHAVGRSLMDRVLLWNFGWISFHEHLLRGLGFGGWELAIQEYVKQVAYPRIAPPPHNAIISLWAQSGLLAALFGILFIISVFILLWKASAEKPWRGFIFWAALGLAWFFIHQQGENWGLLNQRHIVPVIAMIIGIVYTVSRTRTGKRIET